MRVEFTRNFNKIYQKLNGKLQLKVDQRIELLILNQFDPILNNHSLGGVLVGHRSINITGDWRAIFIQEGDRCIFLKMGTHSQLYD